MDLPLLPPPHNFGTNLKFSLMCIEFVFQSLTESPNQDGTMKWYNGISVKMRFIFSRIDAALFSHAFSCILTFNIMRRGRNTAMGKSILVVGPNSRTEKKGTCIEFALLVISLSG